MEENFPRGRRRPVDDDNRDSLSASNKNKKKDDDNKWSKKEDSIDTTNKKRRRMTAKTMTKTATAAGVASDFLFGGTGSDTKKKVNDDGGRSSKRAKVQKDPCSKPTSSNSVLPLGGGGVIETVSKKAGTGTVSTTKTSRWIESLGFSKLQAGLRVLSIVREVHDNLAIFSLPNHWTGFMMWKDENPNGNNNKKSHKLSSSPPCLRVGQILAVTIIKAVQESVKGTEGGGDGGTSVRRRIQVSCLPDPVNNGLFLDHQQSADVRQHVTSSLPDGTILRGQVETIQDHGFIIDLGFSQYGFLAFHNIHQRYRLVDEEDEEEYTEMEEEVGNDDDDNSSVEEEGDGADNKTSTTNNKTSSNKNIKNREEDESVLSLGKGCILDVVVHKPTADAPSSSSSPRQTTTTTGIIVPLRLLSQRKLAQHVTTIHPRQTLHSIQPGQLLPTTIEAWARNGVCVSFGAKNRGSGNGPVSTSLLLRGAVERQHLGSFLIPTSASNHNNNGNDNPDDDWVFKTWQSILPVGHVVWARVIAVDTNSKLVRFSFQNHLIHYDYQFLAFGGQSNRKNSYDDALHPNDDPTTMIPKHGAPHPLNLPEVGTLFRKAVVLRCDPGVGALLALPSSTSSTTTNPENQREEDEEKRTDSRSSQPPTPSTTHSNRIDKKSGKSPAIPPVTTDDRYRQGQEIRAVYVHISKAMDDYNNDKKNKKGDNHHHQVFAKTFAPSTQHDVRILGNSNWLEGFAAGATALSIVNAHVVSYADLVPGKVYKQVTIIRGATALSAAAILTGSSEQSGILVDFGMGVKGYIPPHHLFDQVSSKRSHYRSQLLKVKYATNAKVTVRIVSVDVANRKCIVTAKKSLVAADESPPSQVWTSFETLRVGQVGMGVVSKIDSHKGLYVAFFNGVHGFVSNRHLRQAKEMSTDPDDEISFEVGDVIKCCVLQVQQRRRGGDGQPPHWTLRLGLATISSNRDDEDDDNGGDKEEGNEQRVGDNDMDKRSLDHEIMNIRVGSILPDKCLRVLKLNECQEKIKNGAVVVVPGFALVEVATKHLPIDIENNDKDNDDLHAIRRLRQRLPKSIECKLAFEQLEDDYPPEVIQSAAALNAFAKDRLKVGHFVEGESLIIDYPKKSIADHANGIGKLTTLTLRPKFLESAAAVVHDEKGEKRNHLYVGAVLRGYVSSLDARFGAFVRFSRRMTEDQENVILSGLVPKADSGLTLPLYSTVETRVVTIQPATVDPHTGLRRQKLLLSTKLAGKKDHTRSSMPGIPSVGDVVETAVVEKVTFRQVRVKVIDPKFVNMKTDTVIHFTAFTATSVESTTPSTQDESMEVTMKETEHQSRLAWHSDHPFRNWKLGLRLSNLKVLSIDDHDRTATAVPRVFLGPGMANDSDLSSVEKGGRVEGIITKISKTGAGIWVSLSPSRSGLIPVLEASGRLQVLKNLESHFRPGQRVSARVLGSKSRTAGKESAVQRGEILILTLMNGGGEQESVSIERGKVIVGRVNRRKRIHGEAAPTLVLDLPGQRTGCCCITELQDPGEWVNFPIGNPLKQSLEMDAHTATNDDDDDNDDDESDDNVARDEHRRNNEAVHNALELSSWGQYPHGALIKCRVLGLRSKGKNGVVEVSCRKSRLGGILEDDKLPSVGEKTAAYVVRTNSKGCFLRISRQAEARVALNELSVGFVVDPASTFPPGRLVLGMIKSVVTSSKGITGATRLDMDLRESSLIEDDTEHGKGLSFSNIQVGDKYMGTITRIEDYGAFVCLKNSDVSGLVHKSECSDNFMVDVSSMYNPGDLVKVLVIRKVEDKRQLSLSMKASHFVNDDDDDDSKEDLDEESLSDGLVRDGQTTNTSRPDVVEDDEEEESDEEDEYEDSNDKDDGDDNEEEVEGQKSKMEELGLDTNVGFDWNGGMPPKQTDCLSKEVEDDDDESTNDDDEAEGRRDSDGDEETRGSAIRSSKKTQAARRKEELATAQREAALADGTADESLESSADFERLLASNPNSSELLIRYMAFHLTLADVAAARQVAEKALVRIEFRAERDKMNVWCALLTLEVKYGSQASAEEALARACQQVNPKHIHLRFCEILEKEGSPDALHLLDQLFNRMCKKFRTKKTVWLANLKFLLTHQRKDDAFSLSKRALLSLPKYKHIWLLSHFAQLLFENKKAEQARTVFEALLRENPKRADLLSLFMDQEAKHGDISALRQLCHRVASAGTLSNSADRIMKLSDKQMKKFFKRWFTLEEIHGDEADREAVKTAARRYVEESA